MSAFRFRCPECDAEGWGTDHGAGASLECCERCRALVRCTTRDRGAPPAPPTAGSTPYDAAATSCADGPVLSLGRWKAGRGERHLVLERRSTPPAVAALLVLVFLALALGLLHSGFATAADDQDAGRRPVVPWLAITLGVSGLLAVLSAAAIRSALHLTRIDVEPGGIAVRSGGRGAPPRETVALPLIDRVRPAVVAGLIQPELRVEAVLRDGSKTVLLDRIYHPREAAAVAQAIELHRRRLAPVPLPSPSPQPTHLASLASASPGSASSGTSPSPASSRPPAPPSSQPSAASTAPPGPPPVAPAGMRVEDGPDGLIVSFPQRWLAGTVLVATTSILPAIVFLCLSSGRKAPLRALSEETKLAVLALLLVFVLYTLAAYALNRARIAARGRDVEVSMGPLPWPGGSAAAPRVAQLATLLYASSHKGKVTVRYDLVAFDEDREQTTLLEGFSDVESPRFIEGALESKLGIQDRSISAREAPRALPSRGTHP